MKTEPFEREVIEAPSPNFGERAGGRTPDMIVLHHTAMDRAEAALERLRDPASQVSAHYLIAADGRVWRLVDEARRAWHAGVAAWGGATDVNSRSIGIELDHPGHRSEGDGRPATLQPFAEPQMRRLEALLRAVVARWRIAPSAIVGHSDVAPGRKVDPGEAFDWRRLARRRLADAVLSRPIDPSRAEDDAASVDERLFRAAAAAAGYGDWPTPALLDAVRRRFRPGVVGRGVVGRDVVDRAAAAQPNRGDLAALDGAGGRREHDGQADAGRRA